MLCEDDVASGEGLDALLRNTNVSGITVALIFPCASFSVFPCLYNISFFICVVVYQSIILRKMK